MLLKFILCVVFFGGCLALAWLDGKLGCVSPKNDQDFDNHGHE